MARIEPAGPEHVRAVADLYAAHATGGYATFDLEGLPESVWEERRRASGQGDMLLVAIGDDGAVLGFAWAHPYRPKPAYASTREVAVYVDAAAAGRGIGRALYVELLERAGAAGVHMVVAGIADPNPASTRLHERMGFTRVGTMTEVGHKHGRYRDVTWWQRRLG